MSTRAQKMIQKKDEGDGKDWAVGTYHHWDGYPEGLGAYLKETFKEKGWEWVEGILKHSWSSIWDDECHCCGTMSDGRKEDVSYLPSDTKTFGDTEYMYVFSREAGKDILKTYSGWGNRRNPELSERVSGRNKDTFYGWKKIKETTF